MNTTEDTRGPETLKLTPEQQCFVEDNMPLAFKFANEFQLFRNHADDILGEAFRGLCRAAVDHDPSRSTFGYNAYRWMKYYVYRYIGGLPAVHVPKYLRHQKNRREEDRHRLAPKGMAAMNMADRSWSLGAVESRSEAPCQAVEDADELAWLKGQIDGLDERSRAVVSRRLGGETFRAIGEDMGVTREAVRQIELRARRKIRTAATRQGVMA